jgi:hypothetical protein
LLALTALKLSSLTLTSLGELMLSKSAFVWESIAIINSSFSVSHIVLHHSEPEPRRLINYRLRTALELPQSESDYSP